MPFSFLAPAFLAGLVALAVPIVVHLIHRERRQPVAFPSLMFLRKVPHQSVRRQRLRHLLLFALRCLAVILVVAAFARPFLDRGERRALAAPGGGRELVILLDRSYSMGYGDRWRRATDAARRAADGVAGDDRATVVLFDEGAVAANGPTAERSTLRAAVDSARVGSRATRYAPALALARKILDESTLPRQEAVLISDLQRAGWDPAEDVRLPQGATLTIVDVGGDTPVNVAAAGVELRREETGGRERVTASARLVNTGTEPARNVPVALEVNGRRLATATATVEAKSSATVAFPAVAIPEGESRGTVRLGDDPLPQDNTFHFTVSRGQVLPVLVVEPDDARATTSLYLRRALALGSTPPFRVELRRRRELKGGDLDGRALVILNDAPPPDVGTTRRLADYVRAGGGLLVVAGEHDASREWPAGDAGLLPAEIGPVVDRSAAGGARLASLDRNHPVFEPFNAPRSGDLAASRAFRYRELAPARGATVAARFDDGRPALVEHLVGLGRVTVWASTLDGVWSDLALQPVFLPFVHGLVKHAARYADARAWVTAGQPLDLSSVVAATPSDEDATWVVRSPSGRSTSVSIPAAGTTATTPPVVELTEQGFYEIRRFGDTEAVPRLVAVNVDAAESDMTRLAPDELTRAAAPRAGARQSTALAAAPTAEEKEGRQGMWWYLLAAALVLLGAETLLSNRLSGRRLGEAR
jgi:hypothetical protein